MSQHSHVFKQASAVTAAEKQAWRYSDITLRSVILAFLMGLDESMQSDDQEQFVSIRGSLTFHVESQNHWVLLAKWMHDEHGPYIAIRKSERDANLCFRSHEGVLLYALNVSCILIGKAREAGHRVLVVPGSLKRQQNMSQAILVACTRGLW